MSPRATRRAAYADRQGQRRHRPDYVLFTVTSILLVIGLIVIYAISPGLAAQKNVSDNYYVGKQLITIILGLVAFAIVANIPTKTWKSLQKPLIGVAVFATVVALAMPTSADYPAHRWIRLGGFSLQSVEVVKFSLLIALAIFLAEKVRTGKISNVKQTFTPLMYVLLGLGVVVAGLQHDLGSMGVLMAMIAIMAFVAGIPIKRVLQFSVLIIVLTFLAISTSAYRRDRISTYLHPSSDCQNAGYQACQALISVGSGGIIGKGLGDGVQAYGYLPEAANDSIFAIIGEKFGFLGATIILFLYAVLFSRIKNVLERAPDLFSRFVVAGVLAWFGTQVIMNVGAMIGILPLKGITLPFISSGGTSIIFMLAAVGLVFNISRYTTFSVNTDIEEPSHEDTSQWRRNRRTYNAHTSRRT
ncbi:MAG: putative peptidoglycan glycosyltransferase FtsW [Candidatus Saccharimonadales bacterium]